MMGRLHIVPMIASANPPSFESPILRVAADPSFGFVRNDLTLRAYGEGAVIHVGGTLTRANGWVVKLQSRRAIEDASIEFNWTWGRLKARHRIFFDLMDLGRADDPFWTMDSNYWVLGGYSESRNLNVSDKRRLMAVTAPDPTDLPQNHERSFAWRREDGAFVIDERLKLHAIEFEDAKRLAQRRSAGARQGAAA